MKIVVYHNSFGCETGCCGHTVELEDGRGDFFFKHPHGKQDARAFAEDLVRKKFGAEHVADLDWEHCEIVSYHECDR